MTKNPKQHKHKMPPKDADYFRADDDFLDGEMGPENRIYPEARRLLRRLKNPVRRFFHQLAQLLHLKRKTTW